MSHSPDAAPASPGTKPADRVNGFVRGCLLAVAGTIVAAALLVGLYAPFAADTAIRLLGWAMSESEAGEILIEPGNRFVDAEFTLPFESSPVVTLTPRTLLPSGSFAVTATTADGFRVELSEPAAMPVSFAWTALWTIEEGLADMTETGFPAKLLAATPDGRTFTVRVEAYWEDRPISLRVPDDDLSDPARDEEIATAALEAARTWFNTSFACDWLARLRLRLHARTYDCPIWGMDRPRAHWASIDRSRWNVSRTERGLEIFSAEDTGPTVTPSELALKWAELLRPSAAVDLMRHNNQVLDFVDALQKDSILEPDVSMTIVHLDTHSDLYVYGDPSEYLPREDISDFMNTLLADGRATDVYWVLPDWTRDEDYRESYWAEEIAGGAHPYLAGPRSLEIFIDAEGTLHFGAPPADAADVRVARYHKTLLRDLPDLTGQTQVYLEIDGDYFSNTGKDTYLQGRSNPALHELRSQLAAAADLLLERGVTPRIASWCLSPGYTAPEDELEQERFFLEALRQIPAQDYLLSYAHVGEGGAPPRVETRRRSTPLGRLLLALREQTLAREDSERRIVLEGDALAQATQLAREELGLDSRQALSLLRRLDRFDGRLDGEIDLVDAEEVAALSPPDDLLPSGRARPPR